ncbi:hypothetical protein CCP4SC76_310005 [Gammaproteobacteria bacterium]
MSSFASIKTFHYRGAEWLLDDGYLIQSEATTLMERRNARRVSFKPSREML